MGVKFNREGFVLMTDTGTLIQDSMLSAQSHKRVVPTGVLEAVPNTPGLFYRITHGEAAKLSKAQRTALQQKAVEWLAALQVPTEPEEQAPKGRKSSKHLDELPDTPPAEEPQE